MESKIYLKKKNGKAKNGIIYVNILGYRISTKIKCDSNKWGKGYPNRQQTLLISELKAIQKRIDEYVLTNYKTLTKENVSDLIFNRLDSNSLDNILLFDSIDKYIKSKPEYKSKFNMDIALKELKELIGNVPLSQIGSLTASKINTYFVNRNDNSNTTKTNKVKQMCTFFNYLHKYYDIPPISIKINLNSRT